MDANYLVRLLQRGQYPQNEADNFALMDNAGWFADGNAPNSPQDLQMYPDQASRTMDRAAAPAMPEQRNALSQMVKSSQFDPMATDSRLGNAPQVAKEKQALDAMFQGAIAGGDIEKAVRLATTPEQQALLSVALGQRVQDQDRRARQESGLPTSAPVDLIKRYQDSQYTNVLRGQAQEDRQLKAQETNARIRSSDANANRDNAAVKMEQAKLDQLKLNGGVKLGQNERMGNDGSVELIPNTPQYAKMNDAHSKDWRAKETVTEKTAQVLKDVNYILDPKNEGAFNSHFGGLNAYGTRLIPTDETRNMGNSLAFLKSKLTGSAMDMIRTGGAIGPMAVQEWKIISNMVDNIDPMMGEKKAREAIKEIGNRMENLRDLSSTAYDMEWGKSQFSKNAPTTSGSNVVKLPDGRTKTFPNAAAADAFKKAAGL